MMVVEKIKSAVNGYGPAIKRIVSIVVVLLVGLLTFMSQFVFEKAVSADEEVKLLKKDVEAVEARMDAREKQMDECIAEIKADISTIQGDMETVRGSQIRTEEAVKGTQKRMDDIIDILNQVKLQPAH